MKVFVIISSDGIIKNSDFNVKNWLVKVDVIKDLLGILAIVNVNVINHVTGQYLDYVNCKCRKNLISKLLEECSENIEIIMEKYPILVQYA